MDKSSVLTLFGFLLFLFGMVALILTLVGLQLSFLAFIDAGGRTVGLVVRLLMIFGGVIIMFLARTDWSE